MSAFLVFLMLLARHPLTPLNEAGLDRVIHSKKGKVVVVSVWATWCVPCREEMPLLINLTTRLSSKGVALVLISANDPDEEQAARRFLDSLHVKRKSYIKKTTEDQKFIDSIDRKWSGALPATFVYDRSGKRVQSFFGELSMVQVEETVLDLTRVPQQPWPANCKTRGS